MFYWAVCVSKVCIAILSWEIFLTFAFTPLKYMNLLGMLEYETLFWRPYYFGFPGNCGDILKAAKWKNLGLRPNVTYLPTKPVKFWLVNTPRLSSRLCTITTLTFGNFSCVSSSTLSSSWWSFPSLTYFWADNFGGTDGEFGTITRINNISVRDQKSMQDQRQCVHYFLQSLRKPVFYFLSRIKRPTN